MILTILLLIAILAAMYLLYSGGYLAVHMKRAMLFMGSLDGSRAQFSGCTGHVRRRLRVPESRVYRFELELTLESGAVWLELMDPEKRVLMRLDDSSSAEIALESGRRYHLVIQYRSAKGSHALTYR